MAVVERENPASPVGESVKQNKPPTPNPNPNRGTITAKNHAQKTLRLQHI
jgi:hypothetical protein